MVNPLAGIVQLFWQTPNWCPHLSWNKKVKSIFRGLYWLSYLSLEVLGEICQKHCRIKNISSTKVFTKRNLLQSRPEEDQHATTSFWRFTRKSLNKQSQNSEMYLKEIPDKMTPSQIPNSCTNENLFITQQGIVSETSPATVWVRRVTTCMLWHELKAHWERVAMLNYHIPICHYIQSEFMFHVPTSVLNQRSLGQIWWTSWW